MVLYGRLFEGPAQACGDRLVKWLFAYVFTNKPLMNDVEGVSLVDCGFFFINKSICFFFFLFFYHLNSHLFSESSLTSVSMLPYLT